MKKLKNYNSFLSLAKVVLFFGFVFLTACNRQQEDILKTNNLIDYKTVNRQKNINIDSLYQITIKTPNDTIKVNNLISIFRLSIKNKPLRNDALEEALKISKEINYLTGIANVLNKKGVNARYQHQYLKSLKLHKEALSYYESSWDIQSRIKNLNSLGVTYRRLNIEEEAIKHHLEALKLSEKIDFTRSVAIALNGIGNAYVTLKKYDDAIKYFELSLNLNKLDENERGMGYDYSNLGEAFMYKQQYDTAFQYQNKALEIANNSKNKNDKAIIFGSMGLMFQNKKEWNKALDYYLKSIPILTKYNSKRLLSFTQINTGIIYTQLREFDKAKKYIKSGLQLSAEISSKDNLVLGYQALSDLLTLKGNFNDALDNYKSMVIYRDSIFNIQSENNIVAMNIKFDTNRKDENIKRLHLENKVNKNKSIILFLTLGLLIAISVFSFIYHRMKIKNSNMMLDNMRGQIEAHLDHISNLEGKNITNDISHNLDGYGLSSRELEVLNYITQGMKNQEIADTMFVSLATIKTHTQNIYLKLDVRNRMEAARKAQAI